MKKILYLGTDPSFFLQRVDKEIVHYPVIRLVPKKMPLEAARHASHLLFTSKNAVRFFFDQLSPLPHQKILSIGSVTAQAVIARNFLAHIVAKEETQEGMIACLSQEDMSGWNIFYPRSSRARPNLLQFFQQKNIPCVLEDLYDTLFQKLEPVPNLEQFSAVVFTSPTTVIGFFKIFSKLTIPALAIGPITEQALNLYNISCQRYDRSEV